MGSASSNHIIDMSIDSGLINTYKIGKQIGIGNFGIVRKASLLNDPSQSFAIKTIQKSKIKTNKDYLFQEIEILKKVDHPNIIKLYDVIEEPGCYHLVMELCSDGELYDRISGQGHLDESEAKRLVRQILLAVNHLHCNGIVHRDLKPENFLFEGNELKLIDFGLSAFCTKGKMKTMVGSPNYVSPEVLHSKYDTKCDMWAIGVITYVMLSGSFPFYGRTNKEIFSKIIPGDYRFSEPSWQNVTPQAINFIRQLLVIKPQKRLSAFQALQHPWLQQPPTDLITSKLLISLKEYNSACSFKKEILSLLARYLKSEEISDLIQIFFQINKSCTGVITFDEFSSSLEKIDSRLLDVKRIDILKKLKFKEGKMKYSDFLASVLCCKTILTEKRLKQIFRILDIEKNGFLNAESLIKVFTRFGKSKEKGDVEKMIEDVHPWVAGQVNFNEFKKCIMPLFRSKSRWSCQF
ncbi:unnamed protein product [Blepharisma stoltei]|uniref:non-specific serine/threonine protein kinase n=1 Tax=Blepharisma stoltei TaxID=1481888 RepID=A0AAU9IFT4_9CILI|nr:unnamed protein product [Blepharisma stoltei]